MGRIAFMTDSTAGLPADQVAKYRVEIVPLQVIFGTDEYRDRGGPVSGRVLHEAEGG